MRADPGDFHLERDGLRFEPFNEVNQLRQGGLAPDTWLREYAKMGLADADLGRLAEEAPRA